ncbi:gibberellin-regulated protein 7-like [Durio zibethinus]|uniref:Gibberellin-regulated protein 7-like n=1 Tax=Durio zibethinus TaxID=66656 RepID=A0A6P6B9Q4_DURZI|nr:gibberellin-regulated protein 7-like [Durio zibethinus]
MKLLFPTLLFVSLVLSSLFVQLSFARPIEPLPTPASPAPPASLPIEPFPTPASPPPPASLPPPGFCDSKCEDRCSNAGEKDRCLKYCGICCQECNCVPSGTYGNKSECPCYQDKLNSKGQPKCP